MARYRKKPVEIEARQLTQFTANSVFDWLQQNKVEIGGASLRGGNLHLKIKTLEGDMTAYEGDYIIQGVNGEFYPCKPNIFDKTYEKIE